MLLLHILLSLSSDSSCSSEISTITTVEQATPITPITNNYEYLSSIYVYITELLKLFECEKNENAQLNLNLSLQKSFKQALQFINNKRTDEYTRALKQKNFTDCYYLIEDDLREHKRQAECSEGNTMNLGYHAWLAHFNVHKTNDSLTLKLKRNFRGGRPCIIIVDNRGFVKRCEFDFLCQNVILPIYVFDSSSLLAATVKMDTLLFAYLLGLVKSMDGNGSKGDKFCKEIAAIWKLFDKSARSRRIGVLLHAKLALYIILDYVLCGGDIERLLCILREVLLEGYSGSVYGGSKYDNAILYTFGPIKVGSKTCM